MKHLKYFENRKLIKVGDYVLIKTRKSYNILDKIIKSKEFVDSNIGVCLGISGRADPQIRVKYDNIPFYIQSYFNMFDEENDIGSRTFDIDQVVVYGKTIEELELKIQMIKYNL